MFKIKCPKIPLPIITALSVFILLAVFFKFYGPIQVSVSTKSVTQPSPFSTTGEGIVYTTPDTVSATLGISTNAETVVKAQTVANQTINDIKAGLKQLGVDEKDIKTTNYNIYPNYDYSARTPNITGYNVNISLKVVSEDLSKINDIVDTATRLGANEVRNISFEVKDRQAAIDEATKIAIKDAKEKAQKIARESGISLGKLINVYVSETPNYVNKGLFYDMASSAGTGGGGGTEIEPGQTEITVIATLSYETL